MDEDGRERMRAKRNSNNAHFILMGVPFMLMVSVSGTEQADFKLVYGICQMRFGAWEKALAAPRKKNIFLTGRTTISSYRLLGGSLEEISTSLDSCARRSENSSLTLYKNHP